MPGRGDSVLPAIYGQRRAAGKGPHSRRSRDARVSTGWRFLHRPRRPLGWGSRREQIRFMDQGADQHEADEAAARARDAAVRQDPLLTAPLPSPPALLRAARHYADLSQRELAERAGVAKSVVGDIESGRVASPAFGLVVRLVEAAGLHVRVIDLFAMPVTRRPLDHVLDAGGRHWPGHLDVRKVRSDRDWWYSRTRPGGATATRLHGGVAAAAGQASRSADQGADQGGGTGARTGAGRGTGTGAGRGTGAGARPGPSRRPADRGRCSQHAAAPGGDRWRAGGRVIFRTSVRTMLGVQRCVCSVSTQA
ncbi:MAG: hypothetical protein QOI76_1019 [Frankiales bacterium]|nr:hypothetical protein [Frankiales bacterium]